MTPPFKYLYLDDNDMTTRDGDVELINKIANGINITTDYPCSWAQRADQILKDLNDIDGLVLDWELTNKSEKAKQGSQQAENVDYSAESLAEHLRVNIARHGLKDIPIVLCSADKNKDFTKQRNKELTSKDLFDLTYLKDDLFHRQAESASLKMFDLCQTYQNLQQDRFVVLTALAINEAELESIDIRFIDALENTALSKTTHDLINVLLKEFIEPEGLLIDEFVLASRLGIDISKSLEDWSKLLDVIKSKGIAYEGLLSNGWTKFWAFRLEQFWANTFGGDLRTTVANERVELINKAFGLNVITAEKIKFCGSDEFWTTCVSLKQPLDPSDGFIVGDSLCNPWLEHQYVSALGELEKYDASAWRINVLDRERYNQAKAIITK
jgi:hypothetical protein